jgi:hypothetical protein
MGQNWQDWQTRKTRRPRRIEEANSTEVGFPIVWILIGAVAGLLVIGLIGLGVVNIVRKQAITPTPTAIPGLAPTQAIAEEAATRPAATPTIPPVVTLEPTDTPTPTNTPIPVAPTELAPNVYAKVVGTDASGLSVRAGPGTNNARLTVAPEGSLVMILEGPREDENLDDYIWWFVRAGDNIEGWVVQEFLEPSLPPENVPAAEE